MKIAQQIAKGISEAADSCLSGSESVEDCLDRTRALWERALALGVERQVRLVLQAEAKAAIESFK